MNEKGQFVKIVDGEIWRTFACEYGYLGHRWGFEIMARTFEEAELRMTALKQTAKVSAELIERIEFDSPAPEEGQ